ncbi:MAG: aldo/keto reductase [Pseudomonadota bacterium]
MSDGAMAPRAELSPGYSIAQVINGCWQLTPDHGGGLQDRGAVFAIFDELIEHGFTTFDGADIYTGVESLLGAYRSRLADPHGIQIHTKYVPDRAALETLRPQDVHAAIDRSRRRLGMDSLDLVQFHWWRYEVPGVEMVLECLQEAQARDHVRLLGLTNFDTAHVRKMLDDGAPIVSLQSQYSLLDRRPERAMTSLAEKSSLKLVPYGVLAGGFLTDRYRGVVASASQANRSLTKYRLIIEEAGGWDAYQGLLELLHEIAAANQVSIAAVAARWVLEQPCVAAIMLGVGSRSRAKENLDIAVLELAEDERRALQAALAARPVPPGDMFDLERDPAGRHARIMKTDLNAGAPDGAPS